MARRCSAPRGSSRPHGASRASTTSAGTARAIRTARRARRSRSPRGSSRSPTCSTRSPRSVLTKTPGRRKPASRRSKPELGSVSTPRSSLDSSPWPGRACSSGSARRSRRRTPTKTPEAQPSKTRARGDAHEQRKSDEHRKGHSEEIGQPVAREHPIQIITDQVCADRTADESSSRADGHPDRKYGALASARAREEDTERGIDGDRQPDADEGHRGTSTAERRTATAWELRELIGADHRFRGADPDERDDREDD